MSKELEYLKELQDDLNICSDTENDHYGNKWKSWYNGRFKQALNELNQIHNADLSEAEENLDIMAHSICNDFEESIDFEEVKETDIYKSIKQTLQKYKRLEEELAELKVKLNHKWMEIGFKHNEGERNVSIEEVSDFIESLLYYRSE